ncbi:hypothetical protein OIV83_001580 [Microbotryomycetes sp. JL201]|nr:hypothetical protein OIV83_001580 [Microbotryomycetes sp. JL201]
MTLPTRKIGDQKVGVIGYGAMNLTWRPKVTNDEQAFKCIRDSIDAGSTFINTGEFYGVKPNQTGNLQLLQRFFEKHPDYADKCFVSVKGGVNLETLAPDSSLDALRRSVENVKRHLGDRKKMDLFECARVDKSVPIEEAMRRLLTLRDEGHFKYIGLSEVSAETIRRAAKVAPIAAVEVEYSLAALDIENNGVLDACKELNIPIIAYSPVARGLLTGAIKTKEDIAEGDMRNHLDKFSEDNLEHNLKLYYKIKEIADAKGVTPTQIAIAWLIHAWDGIIPIPGSTRPEGVAEALGAGQLQLTDADLDQIREVLDKTPVKGLRYNQHLQATLEG